MEAEIERVRQDYTKAAKSVTKNAGPLPFIMALLLIAVGIVPLVNHKSDIGEGICFFIGMALIAMGFVAYVYMVNGVANRSLAAAEKSRPGFREFYTGYLSAEKSYLSAQARADAAWDKQMALGLLGAIVGGAIAGTAKGIGETIRRDPPFAPTYYDPSDKVVAVIRDLEKKL